MPIQSNEGMGVLFINRNRANDKQPTHEGNICIDGRQIRIVAWQRKSKAGNMFLALSVDKGDPNRAARAATNDEAPFHDDNDIPF